RADVARVAVAVVVTVQLTRIRDQRAVVDRVTEAVRVRVGLDRVGRAGSRRPGALLADVARADRGTADRGGGLEDVGRTGNGAARARFGQVADAGGAPAHRARRREPVAGTVRRRAGASLGHV